MTRKCAALALLAGLGLIYGCGIQGKWSLADVDPTAARPEVTFTALTLEDDGTFYGQRADGGVSGTYVYEDRVLTLVTQDGTRYTYDAKISGGQLELERPWEGRKLVMEYDRNR